MFLLKVNMFNFNKLNNFFLLLSAPAHLLQSLDGEMQSLVYDNYNKFISATETIRKMKSQVETMETDMKRLEDNMQSIDELSAQVGIDQSEIIL